jgi:hypothetical protein
MQIESALEQMRDDVNATKEAFEKCSRAIEERDEKRKNEIEALEVRTKKMDTHLSINDRAMKSIESLQEKLVTATEVLGSRVTVEQLSAMETRITIATDQRIQDLSNFVTKQQNEFVQTVDERIGALGAVVTLDQLNATKNEIRMLVNKLDTACAGRLGALDKKTEEMDKFSNFVHGRILGLENVSNQYRLGVRMVSGAHQVNVTRGQRPPIAASWPGNQAPASSFYSRQQIGPRMAHPTAIDMTGPVMAEAAPAAQPRMNHYPLQQPSPQQIQPQIQRQTQSQNRTQIFQPPNSAANSIPTPQQSPHARTYPIPPIPAQHDQSQVQFGSANTHHGHQQNT